jgi:3-oxoacyl-[acyl-carrier-protein] synthase-1
LKSFFGHTLGAAGVLESIISIKALEENIVLKSLNFNEQDFENKINIPKENHFSDKKYFIKMLSGFGGCNAALLFSDMRYATCDMRQAICDKQQSEIGNLFIKKHIKLSFKNSAEITEFYRSLQIDYPKFFKMDGLSKLGFLASEMIFKGDENRFTPSENVAVICFNRSSSLDIDTQYQETIRDNENYFPSPSLFVYTLPNIVTGEIAIRNKFFGETSFYICKEFDAKQIVRIVKNAFGDKTTTAVLAAWIEHFEGKYEVFMALIERGKGDVEFTENQIDFLNNKF